METVINFIADLASVDPNRLQAAHGAIDRMITEAPHDLLAAAIAALSSPHPGVRGNATTVILRVCNRAASAYSYFGSNAMSPEEQAALARAQAVYNVAAPQKDVIVAAFAAEREARVLRGYAPALTAFASVARGPGSKTHSALQDWPELMTIVQGYLGSSSTAEQTAAAMNFLADDFDHMTKLIPDTEVPQFIPYVSAFSYHLGSTTNDDIAAAAARAAKAVLSNMSESAIRGPGAEVVPLLLNQFTRMEQNAQNDMVPDDEAINVLMTICELCERTSLTATFVTDLFRTFVGYLSGAIGEVSAMATSLIANALSEWLMQKRLARRVAENYPLPALVNHILSWAMPKLTMTEADPVKFETIDADMLAAATNDNEQLEDQRLVSEAAVHLLAVLGKKFPEALMGFIQEQGPGLVASGVSVQRYALLTLAQILFETLSEHKAMTIDYANGVMTLVMPCKTDPMPQVRAAFISVLDVMMENLTNIDFANASKDAIIGMLFEIINTDASNRVISFAILGVNTLLQVAERSYVVANLDNLMAFIGPLVASAGKGSNAVFRAVLGLLSVVALSVEGLMGRYYNSLMEPLIGHVSAVFSRTVTPDDPLPGLLISAVTKIGDAAGPSYFRDHARAVIEGVQVLNRNFLQNAAAAEDKAAAAVFDTFNFCTAAYVSIARALGAAFLEHLTPVTEMLFATALTVPSMQRYFSMATAERLQELGRCEIIAYMSDLEMAVETAETEQQKIAARAALTQAVDNKMQLKPTHCMVIANGATDDAATAASTIFQIDDAVGAAAYEAAVQHFQRIVAFYAEHKQLISSDVLIAGASAVYTTMRAAMRAGAQGPNMAAQAIAQVINIVTDEDCLDNAMALNATDAISELASALEANDAATFNEAFEPRLPELFEMLIEEYNEAMRGFDSDRANISSDMIAEANEFGATGAADEADEEEISDKAVVCVEFINCVGKVGRADLARVLVDQCSSLVHIWLSPNAPAALAAAGSYMLSVIISNVTPVDRNYVVDIIQRYNAVERCITAYHCQEPHVAITGIYTLGLMFKHQLIPAQAQPAAVTLLVEAVTRPDARLVRRSRITDNAVTALMRAAVYGANAASAGADTWLACLKAFPITDDLTEAIDGTTMLLDLLEGSIPAPAAFSAPEVQVALGRALTTMWKSMLLEKENPPFEPRIQAAVARLAAANADGIRAILTPAEAHVFEDLLANRN